MWLEMFHSFSEESIRYRFFQLLRDTPHEVRVRYCNIDYDREIAIVAELMEEGNRKILGVSRFSVEPDGKTGELAFIVGDKWQNLGLGTKMIDHVLDIAKEMSIEKVYSIMLPDNYRALSLTKKMGFELTYLEDGTVKGMLSLKDEFIESECRAKIGESQTKPKVVEEKQKSVSEKEDLKEQVLKEKTEQKRDESKRKAEMASA
jgi:acetyltransferase